ncbi:phosphonate ABC transporter, permease protein PhnE [Candidatus Bipolaricaulota bacterium]
MTDPDQAHSIRASRERKLAFRNFRRRVLVLLTDILFVAVFWMFATYIAHNPERGVAPFLSVPWWVMLLCSVVVAVGWQMFGVSPGMKLMGRGRADIKRAWYRQSWSLGTILLLLATFGVAVIFTRVDPVKVFTDADNIAAIMNQFLHPDWSVWYLGGQRLIVTLFMALMATLFGMIVALPLSFIAARNLTQGAVARVIYTIVRGFLSFVRAIPAIVWAILFVVWVKSGNAAMGGVMALFVHSVADLTKLYAERLESIDPGPVEAIRAAGASRLQVIIYGIVPQIVNPYLSFSIYRLDINVRMSTIIGLVGGGGIGAYLAQTMRVNQYERSIVLMMMIMLTVWSMDTMSARLRERIETGSMPQTPPNYALRMKERISSRIK